MSKKIMKAGVRIGHKIQPQKFESLEVSIHLEEALEYESETERKKLLADFVSRARGDFQEAEKAVHSDLGVSDRPVSVTLDQPDGTVKSAALPTANPNKKSLAPSDLELEELFGNDTV